MYFIKRGTPIILIVFREKFALFNLGKKQVLYKKVSLPAEYCCCHCCPWRSWPVQLTRPSNKPVRCKHPAAAPLPLLHHGNVATFTPFSSLTHSLCSSRAYCSCLASSCFSMPLTPKKKHTAVLHIQYLDNFANAIGSSIAGWATRKSSPSSCAILHFAR